MIGLPLSYFSLQMFLLMYFYKTRIPDNKHLLITVNQVKLFHNKRITAHLCYDKSNCFYTELTKDAISSAALQIAWIKYILIITLF